MNDTIIGRKKGIIQFMMLTRKERRWFLLTLKRADNNRESISICDSDEAFALPSLEELEAFLSFLSVDCAAEASDIKT